MNISEKDLFLYKFYPSQLSTEKVRFIDENVHLFTDSLNYLNEYRKNLEDNISDSDVDSIISKIGFIEKNNSVYLTKLESLSKKSSEFLTLAADSPKLEKSVQTDTFVDSNSKYLVKIISTKESNKVYIFNKDYSPMENIEFTVYPDEKTFKHPDTTSPLVIQPPMNIDKIKISFF